MTNTKLQRANRRKKRVSSNFWGTKSVPRISIYRSNNYIYAQAISDEDRKTLASFSSLQMKKTAADAKKQDQAKQVGQELAKLLLKKDIKTGVFDRSSYPYLGRVKQVAEGLREGGIKI